MTGAHNIRTIQGIAEQGLVAAGPKIRNRPPIVQMQVQRHYTKRAANVGRQARGSADRTYNIQALGPPEFDSGAATAGCHRRVLQQAADRAERDGVVRILEQRWITSHCADDGIRMQVMV